MHTSDTVGSKRQAGRISRAVAATVLALTGLVAAGCTESVPPPTVNSLRILPQSDSFYVGRTTTGAAFTVSMFDAKGVEITDGRPITYTSTAPTVFSVDASTGRLTGNAIGNGLFRATVSGKFIEAGVKIIFPVDKVQLNTTDVGLIAGTQRQLIPTLVAADGSTISGRTVTYASSNLTVASVSTQGLITALAEGTAQVTATSEGKTATANVTVTRDPVAQVRLTPTFSQLLRVGGTLQVTATALNTNGQVLTGRTVTWSSSQQAVATVNAQGLVTALTPGTTTITADIEGKTSSVGVTVTLVPVGTVSFTPTADTLIVGDQRQYNPVVTDTAGRPITSLLNRTVGYIASNNLLIGTQTVSAGVVVSASNAEGDATVTAIIDNVSSTPPLSLHVTNVGSITMTPSTSTLAVSGTATITLVLKDANNNVLKLTRPIVAWNSNAPAIVSVANAAGGLTTTITARALGTATISATIGGATQSIQITVQ